MKLERLPPGQTAGAAGAWVGGLLVLGAAGAALWMRLGLPLPTCRIRDWTGVPCATCGSTRLVEALLAGDPAEALAWNPLVFTILTALSIWSLTSVTRSALGLPGLRLTLERRERIVARWLAAVTFVAGWAYVIWNDV